MICPRCAVAEISQDSDECQLCGYSPARASKVAVLAPDELDEVVRVQLASAFHLEREIRRSDDVRTYVAADSTGRSVVLTVFFRANPKDSAAEQRFARAIDMAKLLDHPHIVPLYDAGATAAFFWCSSKLIEARSIAENLRQSGPLELSVCRRIVEQVASALDYAHRRGISHGHVSIDNVLVDSHEWAFITHFGISQALRGISQTRHGGPSGDQRDLAEFVAESLNLARDPHSVPPEFFKAVDRAASPNPANRFSTVLDFVASLSSGAMGVIEAPVPMAPAPSRRRSAPSQVLIPPEPEIPPQALAARRPSWVLPATIMAIALALAGAAWAFWLKPKPLHEGEWYQTPPASLPDTTRAPVASVLPPSSGAAAEPERKVAAPPVVPPTPARAAPVPVTRPAPVAVPQGKLFVNATPWGRVYLDGEFIGNTPQLDLSIPAGAHALKVVRDGFEPYERQVVIVAGQELRLTDLVLSRP